jgi:hypothetical protein
MLPASYHLKRPVSDRCGSNENCHRDLRCTRTKAAKTVCDHPSAVRFFHGPELRGPCSFRDMSCTTLYNCSANNLNAAVGVKGLSARCYHQVSSNFGEVRACFDRMFALSSGHPKSPTCVL